MGTCHWGQLFCKNYPKKRESNVINVFIGVQQQYKENREDNMKEDYYLKESESHWGEGDH